MKAWEIWSYKPNGWAEPHPAVIVSHPDRVANKPEFNVLVCSSKRAQGAPMPNEVVWDSNDGLCWPALCECDMFYAVHVAELSNRRGVVTSERRKLIISTIMRANGWTP